MSDYQIVIPLALEAQFRSKTVACNGSKITSAITSNGRLITNKKVINPSLIAINILADTAADFAFNMLEGKAEAKFTITQPMRPGVMSNPLLTGTISQTVKS